MIQKNALDATKTLNVETHIRMNKLLSFDSYFHFYHPTWLQELGSLNAESGASF